MKLIGSSVMILIVTAAIYSQTEIQATWTSNATGYRGTNSRVTFVCPPGGTGGTVWGTDTYTDDSSVCTAATHAGLIGYASGGRVTIEIRPGLSGYQGTTRNGVTSNSYNSWPGSYLFVGVAPPGQPTTAAQFLARGMNFVAERDYKRALADFDEAIRREPNNGTAYLNRGLANMRLGNTEQALVDTNRAIELLPSLSLAYSNRSFAYSVMGKKVLARADAEKAIALDSGNARAYLARGVTMLTENLDSALADVERSIQLEPSFGGGFYFRGRARFDKGQFELARQDFQKAIDLKVDVADIVEWRDRADAALKRASAPPTQTGGETATPAQPVKCQVLMVRAANDRVAPGQPAFFAAAINGKFLASAPGFGYTWSTTHGKIVQHESTAVVDTSGIEAAATITVAAEIFDQSMPSCRSGWFASASVTIRAPEAAPATPAVAGSMIFSFEVPLDEESNSRIFGEVQRYSQLAKAGVIGEELQIHGYSGPLALPGETALTLEMLKAFLRDSGADVSRVKFIDKGKRDKSVIEIWKVQKAPARKRPASAKGKKS